MTRVLLVENDSLCRAEVADILGEHGFEVRQARDGAEALRLLGDAPAPDVILLDLVTPVMDGWGFRRAQSADPRYSGIPVVLMSGLPDLSSQARALGAAGHLRKPFSLQALLESVTTPVHDH